MNMNKKRHCVYLINCHVIFVVKYRRPCIDDEIGAFLIEEVKRLLIPWNATLIEGKADKDHLHLLLSIDPQYQISDMIGSIKGVLSRNVRKNYHDRIKDQLWGDSFWTDSYYIASTGNVSTETVRQYIEEQGRPKRKYTKKNKT